MRRNFTLPAILLAAAIIPLLLLPGTSRAQTGSEAPGFSIRDLNGRTFRLSDFKGRPVIIGFWATWCRPCRTTLPNLDQIQKRYGPEGLAVIGMTVDDLRAPMVRRITDEWGVRIRVALANQRVLDLYGPLRAVPTTIFINRRGVMIRRVTGYVDGETLETYASELFGSPSPRSDSTSDR